MHCANGAGSCVHTIAVCLVWQELERARGPVLVGRAVHTSMLAGKGCLVMEAAALCRSGAAALLALGDALFEQIACGGGERHVHCGAGCRCVDVSPQRKRFRR